MTSVSPDAIDVDLSSRQRIVASAAELFSSQGYADTTLRQLAAELDMQAGSLYYHFESKDKLFIEVLRVGMSIMIDSFDRTQTEADLDAASPSTRLSRHVSAHLDALHSHFAFTSLHVVDFRRAPEAVRNAVVPDRDHYESLWHSMLSDLLDEWTADDVRAQRLVLFGAMNASVDWFDADRGTLDRFARVVTRQFCPATIEEERSET